MGRRIDALEAALTPLQRAWMLVERGVPPSAWPDPELEAFHAAECADLADWSDEALEAAYEQELY